MNYAEEEVNIANPFVGVGETINIISFFSLSFYMNQ